MLGQLEVNLAICSVEETEDLSTNLGLSGGLVIHDTLVGGEDDVTELSGWEDLIDELLEVLGFKVESWGDDTAFVESSVEVNNDLSGSLVINDLEFTDVAVALHSSEELDNDLGDWSEHNLSLTGFLGVDHLLEAVVQNGHSNHCAKGSVFKK